MVGAGSGVRCPCSDIRSNPTWRLPHCASLMRQATRHLCRYPSSVRHERALRAKFQSHEASPSHAMRGQDVALVLIVHNHIYIDHWVMSCTIGLQGESTVGVVVHTALLIDKQAGRHAAVRSAYNQNKAFGNYHLSMQCFRKQASY